MRRHLLALFCATLSFGGLAMDARAATTRTATSKGDAQSAPTQAVKPKVRKVAARALYTTRASSATPQFVWFVRDGSGSNQHHIGGTDKPMTKGDAIATAINLNLESIVANSVDGMSEGTDTTGPVQLFKGWFKVGGNGYASDVHPLIGKEIKLLTTTELAHGAQWFDGNDKPVTGDSKPEDFQRMKWVAPKWEGFTHMAEGLAESLPHLKAFVAEHPDAPAPVVIHFTDGKPDGKTGPPQPVADAIQSIRTKDGHALLFNIHVGEQGETFMFPNQKVIDRLTGELRVDAQRLFNMSSPMPPSMHAKARALFPEYRIPADARMMVYNANGAVLTQLIEMGTIQTMK